VEKIIERFAVEFNLTQKEAKVYYMLCKLGPTKASILAHQLGISRPEIYNILKKLQEKGMVESTLERPMKFMAISFEKVIDRLIKEEEKRIEEIKTVIEKANLFSPHLRSNKGNYPF
jgi:sugar-specific transcriptional regulator TrmB